MEILKKGTKDLSSKKYVKKCSYCGCIFSYTFDDAKAIGWWEDCNLRLECPQCNNYSNYPLFFKRKYKEEKWKKEM